MIARALVGRQDAEDVVQEAIVRVLRAAARGTVIENPGAYLRATVRHVAVDHLRVVGRESLPGELPERESHRSDPQTAVELRELLTAIEGLPERQRAALLATALTDQEQKQLANPLKTTPAGVRQLVRRARQQLRDTLGAWVPGPVAWLATRARRVVGAVGVSGAAHGAAAAVIVTVVIVAPKPPHPPHPPTPNVPSVGRTAPSHLHVRQPAAARPLAQVWVRSPHP